MRKAKHTVQWLLLGFWLERKVEDTSVCLSFLLQETEKQKTTTGIPGKCGQITVHKKAF